MGCRWKHFIKAGTQQWVVQNCAVLLDGVYEGIQQAASVCADTAVEGYASFEDERLARSRIHQLLKAVSNRRELNPQNKHPAVGRARLEYTSFG